MPLRVVQLYVFEVEISRCNPHGVGTRFETCIQDIDLHTHVCLYRPFQVKPGERPEKAHVPVCPSPYVTEYVFDKRLQERHIGSARLNMQVQSFQFGRYISVDARKPRFIFPYVGKQTDTAYLLIPTAGYVSLPQQCIVQREIAYIEPCLYHRVVHYMMQMHLAADESVELHGVELNHVHDV